MRCRIPTEPVTCSAVCQLVSLPVSFCLSVCQHLWSASQRKLIVPRYRLNSFDRRCFAVVGPSTWNSLQNSIGDPAESLSMFRRQLKTYFFDDILTRCAPCIRDLLIMRYIDLHFTYLLTLSLFVCLSVSLFLCLRGDPDGNGHV